MQKQQSSSRFTKKAPIRRNNIKKIHKPSGDKGESNEKPLKRPTSRLLADRTEPSSSTAAASVAIDKRTQKIRKGDTPIPPKAKYGESGGTEKGAQNSVNNGQLQSIKATSQQLRMVLLRMLPHKMTCCWHCYCYCYGKLSSNSSRSSGNSKNRLRRRRSSSSVSNRSVTCVNLCLLCDLQQQH